MNIDTMGEAAVIITIAAPVVIAWSVLMDQRRDRRMDRECRALEAIDFRRRLDVEVAAYRSLSARLAALDSPVAATETPLHSTTD